MYKQDILTQEGGWMLPKIYKQVPPAKGTNVPYKG